MMKSYIAIQSTLFNGVIDLVGYTDMQGNIRLTHTSIYAYISRTFPQMSMEFDVRSTDVNHAVVVCRLRSKIFDGSVRTVTEIGETSASLLPDKFNGDVGVITEIHNGMTVSLGDETVSLGEYDLDEILPADVITVHKSQGGEYEDVYVMLPEKPRVLLTRNILNTAVSRARKKVMLFTVRNSLSICVSNVMSHNRDTWLSIFFQQDN